MGDPNALLTRQASNRWLALIALLVAAAIASVGLLLVSQAIYAANLRTAVEASFERRLKFERVLSMHQDLETASRGYVLTGREDFLSPLYAAEPMIEPEFAALERISADGSGGSRLTRLRHLSKQKRDFVDETVRLFGEGARSDAMERIRSGEGKRRMDAIRAEIARLQNHEAAFLASASAKS
ncbi:MAG: CHASE3 domain-containing protein, partial [Pseudomonadota bacterium]